MRLHWKKGKESSPAVSEAALAAEKQTNKQLAEVEDQWPEVHRIVTALKKAREKNNFGPRIEQAYRERSR